MIRPTPILRDGLLAWAKAYAKATRTTLRAVSRRIYGDWRVLGRIGRKRGKDSISTGAYEKGMAWLEDPKRWPDDAVPTDLKDPLAGMKEPKP